MTLQVRGPRAQQFVTMLARFTGFALLLQNGTVSLSADTLIDPFESETLQNLLMEIIRSPNVVEVAALGGHPPSGFSVDPFRLEPSVRHPRRSVYVADLLKVERMSSILARATVGHVLQENLAASRPPGGAAEQIGANYHVPAVQTEAQIVSDLTGRPIWTGSRRPWDNNLGNTMVRSFGPDLSYQLVFGSDGNLRRIIEPQGL